MSFNDCEVTFSVFSGGHWVKNHSGDISYIGGESRSIDCYPEAFFTTLSEDEFAGQKVWYKMPFELLHQRKLLRNGEQSFHNMVEAAKWCGVVEIFMVNEVEHPVEEAFYEHAEEEIRVERNVAGFVDEDPNFDYHNTPPNSDGEEDGVKLVRWKKGIGELKLNQVFDTLEEFKDALVEYSLKEGWNIKQNPWGKIKCGAICGVEDGCLWRIYCSYEEHLGKWKVKTYEDVHTCFKDGRSKILKKSVIVKLFLDEIRTYPEYRPKMIQDQIQQRYNLIATYDQCKKAKEKTISIINSDYVEQFSRLKDYRNAILEQNKESTVVLETVPNDDGNEIFRRFYVCFEAMKNAWTMWCRPVFGVDGCFMKCTLKGQLLAAVGKDANNGMYPFAWAVVDVENEENWTWFFKLLKADFNLQQGQHYTIISDRQKGLLNAVQNELPHIEH
ncbi:uncharacterized protein LOC112081609 [Eutrema salsugineum]|uniref:uncharacterized protein LOC112081609 n=1 Tax=Eutrema salsugineum TaxID=72664 RepID=UPI000CED03AC|nr:uncharacterized protein LOC112081609 [Eutrema salsugineum]